MKTKTEHWNINSQEDEDGFSLNPYEVFIDDSINLNQSNHLIRNTEDSGSGTAAFIMITAKENRNKNKITCLQSV